MRAQPENPYQAPEDIGTGSPAGPLPDTAVKQVTKLIRDARLSATVGLIPLLGLIFIVRLVRWYQLKEQFPVLVAGDAGEQSELVIQYRIALPSLWFAVLLWPGIILFVIVYLFLTG